MRRRGHACLLAGEEEDLNDDCCGENDKGHKDIPAIEGAEDQIEDDDQGQQDALANSGAHRYVIAAGGEQATTEYISDWRKRTGQGHEQDDKYSNK